MQNQIRSVGSRVFSAMKNLTWLDMSFNQMTSSGFPDGVLLELNKLQTLSLRYICFLTRCGEIVG